MKKMYKILLGTVLALAMVITALTSLNTINAKADEGREFIHVLYRTTGGELSVLWKLEVEKDKETGIAADLMKDYDAEGIIGTIDDLVNIRGIIVLKYRPDRDADKAPDPVSKGHKPEKGDGTGKGRRWRKALERGMK